MAEFSCRNVYERGAPVLYVVHDHDDDWQMLCGGDEHNDDREIVVLHKKHLQERDSSFAEVFDMAPGWEAERESPDAVWKYQPFEEDDD